MTDTIDWNQTLSEQLDFHWTHQLRPRLDGLTDEEYLWEPVAGAWNVRSRADATTSHAAGGGDLVLDYAVPEPEPTPVPTIAWRLAHVIIACLGRRNAAHFGGPPAEYDSWEYAGTADAALAQLDEQYARWHAGVTALGEEGLVRPVGPAEGPWADASYAVLVLHINRELIHHGAEIALLRDLYAHR
ncbi:MAG: DinB family protein [Nocardioides sp.]